MSCCGGEVGKEAEGPLGLTQPFSCSFCSLTPPSASVSTNSSPTLFSVPSSGASCWGTKGEGDSCVELTLTVEGKCGYDSTPLPCYWVHPKALNREPRARGVFRPECCAACHLSLQLASRSCDLLPAALGSTWDTLDIHLRTLVHSLTANQACPGWSPLPEDPVQDVTQAMCWHRVKWGEMGAGPARPASSCPPESQ